MTTKKAVKPTPLIQILFPRRNRRTALVSFLRTAWQTMRSTTTVASGGGILLTASDLIAIDWTAVAFGVGAVLASSIIAGLLAAGDFLTHGLPTQYSEAAEPAGSTS